MPINAKGYDGKPLGFDEKLLAGRLDEQEEKAGQANNKQSIYSVLILA